MEFDEKGNLIRNKGMIESKPEPRRKKKGSYSKGFEKSYLKLDPRSRG